MQLNRDLSGSFELWIFIIGGIDEMFMGPTDDEIVAQFKGELKNILNQELQTGNTVCETYIGDWPYPNSIMVFLEKPFLTPIRKDINGIEFRNINNPHYWKAEYFDLANNQFLCCKFGGIPNFDDM